MGDRMRTICLNCGWAFSPKTYYRHTRACLDGADTVDEKVRRLARLLACEFNPAVPRDEDHYRRARLLILNARSIFASVEREADAIAGLEREFEDTPDA